MTEILKSRLSLGPWTLSYIGFLLLSATFTQYLRLWVENWFGSFVLEFLIWSVFGLLAGVFVWYLGRVRRQELRVEPLLVLAVGVIGASFLEIPVERMHVVLYGALGWIVVREEPLKQRGAVLFFVALIVPTLEESFQYILPRRVADPRDILLGFVSVLWGGTVAFVSRRRMRQSACDERVEVSREEDSPSPSTRWWKMSPVLLAWAAAILLASHLMSLDLVSQVPFDTDEADHANAALELYQAVRHGTRVVDAVVRQAFYPPVYSLFGAGAYLAFGPSLWSSRVPSAVLYVLATMALTLAVTATRLGRSGAWGGVLAGFLFLTSPLLESYSVLAMLEVTGAAMIAFLFLLAARSESVIALSVLSLVVLLTKYNYGFAICPALIGTLLLTPNLSLRERVRSALFSSATILLGIGVWLCVTDWRAAWHFVVGHPSYRPLLSAAHLLFYPRAWLTSWSVHPFVGVLAIGFAVYSLKCWAQLPVRMAVLTAVATSLMLTLSTTDEVRHLLPGAVALWMLAGTGCTAFLTHRSPVWRSVVFVPLIFLLPQLGGIENRVAKALEGKVDYREAMEFVAANIDPQVPVLVNGLSDSFGLESLRWTIAARADMRYTAVQVDGFPLRERRWFSQEKRKRNIDTAAFLPISRALPLPELLAHYGAVVDIAQKGRARSPQTRRLHRALADRPPLRGTFGDREILIFSLKGVSK